MKTRLAFHTVHLKYQVINRPTSAVFLRRLLNTLIILFLYSCVHLPPNDLHSCSEEALSAIEGMQRQRVRTNNFNAELRDICIYDKPETDPKSTFQILSLLLNLHTAFNGMLSVYS